MDAFNDLKINLSEKYINTLKKIAELNDITIGRTASRIFIHYLEEILKKENKFKNIVNEISIPCGRNSLKLSDFSEMEEDDD